MVWGAIFGIGKRLLGGRKKKEGSKADTGPTKGEQLKGDATRTVKSLLTPVKSTRKAIRGVRAGARKAISRGSGRSGGR